MLHSITRPVGIFIAALIVVVGLAVGIRWGSNQAAINQGNTFTECVNQVNQLYASGEPYTEDWLSTAMNDCTLSPPQFPARLP